MATTEEIALLSDNRIIGNLNLDQSKVVFEGVHNILITPAAPQEKRGVVLSNSVVKFCGNNSLVFLSNSDCQYFVDISLYNNSFCYIGADNYFSSKLMLQCSEQCNILIGDDCMFSSGVWIRTSDVHLIYDVESRTRINNSKSVFIGDHVWIGQDAKLWKGSRVGSGAILGAGAFTSGKAIPSNTLWGGTPARQIRSGVTFISRISTHRFAGSVTEESQVCPEDHLVVYQFAENETKDFSELEKTFQSCGTMGNRVAFLQGLSEDNAKNRFFIG